MVPDLVGRNPFKMLVCFWHAPLILNHFLVWVHKIPRLILYFVYPILEINSFFKEFLFLFFGKLMYEPWSGCLVCSLLLDAGIRLWVVTAPRCYQWLEVGNICICTHMYVHTHTHICTHLQLHWFLHLSTSVEIHEFTLTPSIPIKQHRVQSCFLPFHIYLVSLCSPSPMWKLPIPTLCSGFDSCTGLPSSPLHTYLPHSGSCTAPGHFPCVDDFLTSLSFNTLRWPFLIQMASLLCMNSDISSWAFFPCGLPPQPTPALKPHIKFFPCRDTLRSLRLPAWASSQGWCSPHSAWTLILHPTRFPL